MTSVLNVDTIADKAGTGPVSLTKQEATKHWVTYDAVSQTTDGSLNQSSITDYNTGEFKANFANAFSSATNKAHFASAWNSNDGGSSVIGARTRAGVVGNIGVVQASAAPIALTTSDVQFYLCYGSNSSSDGGQIDGSASYVCTIGDLA